MRQCATINNARANVSVPERSVCLLQVGSCVPGQPGPSLSQHSSSSTAGHGSVKPSITQDSGASAASAAATHAHTSSTPTAGNSSHPKHHPPRQVAAAITGLSIQRPWWQKPPQVSVVSGRVGGMQPLPSKKASSKPNHTQAATDQGARPSNATHNSQQPAALGGKLVGQKRPLSSSSSASHRVPVASVPQGLSVQHQVQPQAPQLPATGHVQAKGLTQPLGGFQPQKAPSTFSAACCPATAPGPVPQQLHVSAPASAGLSGDMDPGATAQLDLADPAAAADAVAEGRKNIAHIVAAVQAVEAGVGAPLGCTWGSRSSRDMRRRPKEWIDLVAVEDISVIDKVEYKLYTWGASKALQMMLDSGSEHNNTAGSQQQLQQPGAADSAAMGEEPEDGCTYFEHVLAVEGFAGEGAAVNGLLSLQHAQLMSTDK